MSRSLLFSALALGLVLSQAPAHAQPLNGAGQFPPAPNSAAGAPQPLNALPRGGATGAVVAPGASINSAPTAPMATAAEAPSVNSLHPLRQPRRAVHRPVHRPTRAARRATAAE